MLDMAMEWLGYLGHWSHALAAITWIGTSFYFNWLDLPERSPQAPTLKSNVVGAVHEMHGGSFYYHERYWPTQDSPRTLAHSGPAQLTFLTGLFLVAHIYWLGAGAFLVDGSGGTIGPAVAVLLSAGVIFLPWFLYDFACRRTCDDELITVVVAVIVLAASYVVTQAFSSRAAFVHVGAMMGTILAKKDLIFNAAIASDLMPPGNMTEMTDAERKVLGDWLALVGARQTKLGE